MTSCAKEIQAIPPAQLLAELLAALRAASVPVLQLRPRSFDDPAIHEGDFDFLIDHRHRKRFLKAIISLLTERQCFFLVHTPSRPGSRKTVVQIHDRDAERFVTLEFWHEALYKPGRRFCGAVRWKDVVWGIKLEQGEHRLSPQAGALIFLAHLHAKGKRLSSPLVLERLLHFRKSIAASPSSDSALSRELIPVLDELFFGKISIAQANHIAMRLLRQHSRLRLLRGVALMQARRMVSPFRRFGRRFARRCIAVEGPDGSGKTTIVEALYKNATPGSVRARVFKDFFRDRLIYNALGVARRLMPRSGRPNPPRNLWEERIGGLIALMALPAFLWAAISARRQLLVVDRYFYDYLMVDIRRRRTCPRMRRPWRQALLPLFPRPGLVINPLAEHQTTLSREDPLSQEGFNSYQRQLVDMLSRRPPASFVHIPASHGLEQCLEYALTAAKRCAIGYTRKATYASGELWREKQVQPTGTIDQANAQEISGPQARAGGGADRYLSITPDSPGPPMISSQAARYAMPLRIGPNRT